MARKDAAYTFDYIDESRVYSFVDKKSGCVVFLTFSNVTKDKATVRMADGFWEKEFTAKEFAKTFDDDEERGYCGCPCQKRYLEEELFMIYKYDDIVKTIKGKFMFSRLGCQDVGKIITVCGLNGPGNCFGGRIDEVCDYTIIYKREFIEDGKRKYTSSCITAEGIGGAPDCKICIYDSMTGEHVVYRSDEFVHSMKSKIEFNTDILKPGSEFIVENCSGTSICEVMYCYSTTLKLEESSVLEGIRIFNLDNAYDIGDLKSLIFKTMDEFKPFDLVCRGFSGKYKLSVGAIYDIKNILDKEDLSE